MRTPQNKVPPNFGRLPPCPLEVALQPRHLSSQQLELNQLLLLLPVGLRMRGTLGDIDPLNKVPVKRATSRVQKGPL